MEALLEADLHDHLMTCAGYLRNELRVRTNTANLRGPDFLALRALATFACPMTPSDLAGALRCSRSQVTRIGKRLLAAQHIRVHHCAWAPRSKKFEATASGLEALAHATATLESESRFSPLTTREQRALHRLLGKLQRGLEAAAIIAKHYPRESVPPAEVVPTEISSAGEGSTDGNQFFQRR